MNFQNHVSFAHIQSHVSMYCNQLQRNHGSSYKIFWVQKNEYFLAFAITLKYQIVDWCDFSNFWFQLSTLLVISEGFANKEAWVGKEYWTIRVSIGLGEMMG